MGVDITGHPSTEIYFENGSSQLITVCAHCGEMRSILFLRRDRWYCTRCRIEGAAPPNLYPVS